MSDTGAAGLPEDQDEQTMKEQQLLEEVTANVTPASRELGSPNTNALSKITHGINKS